jgi:hypothetical protein
MSWWSKLLGGSCTVESGVLRLAPADAWQIGPPRDSAAFIRELGRILPTPYVFYFEGVSMDDDVHEFMMRHQIAAQQSIGRGTIWPTPARYHIPGSPAVCAQVADMFDRHAEPEVCDHLHVYDADGLLLEWHDAFGGLPLLLSKRVTLQQVERMCEVLGCCFAQP